MGTLKRSLHDGKLAVVAGLCVGPRKAHHHVANPSMWLLIF